MTKWTIFVVLVYAAALTAARVSAQVPPALAPDFKLAEEEFDRLCEGCHGERGEGGDGAPALINNRNLRRLSENQICDLIKNGTLGGMPALLSLSVNCAR
jgi:hypothetical protein